jgi:hypothetical protein
VPDGEAAQTPADAGAQPADARRIPGSEPGARRKPRAPWPRWVRWPLVALAAAALAAAVPVVPVTWANLTNFSFVGHDQIGGNVTVTACFPRWLPGEWECRGSFAYDDPIGNGTAVTPDVALANDPHDYRPGTVVGTGNELGVAIRPGTHRAYDFGTAYGLSVLRLLFGLALCALAAVLAVACRRRPRLRTATVFLVVGVLCAAGPLRMFWP